MSKRVFDWLRQHWPLKRKPRKKRKWYIRVLRFILFLPLWFLLFLFLIDINFLWLFGKSPGLSDIKNPEQSIASEIYSADGKMIGRFYRENRTPVRYEELSPLLVQTLIATEDERYYSHFGIDFKGLFSAGRDWMRGRFRGASTLSQQLVKNMFKSRTAYSTGLFGYIPGVRVFIMKMKEWIGAVKAEWYYSKEEIIAMYLNTVDFCNNTYGIKTAARVYFSRSPSELEPQQIAMLIGMLKATSKYNPLKHPEACTQRRNVVLGIMRDKKLITDAAYDSLTQSPLGVSFKPEDVTDGDAPYFRMAVAESMKEWCSENELDLYTSGLKIYTTIDTRLQHYAEESVNKHMTFLQADFDEHWGSENPWKDINYVEIPDFIESNALESPRYKRLRKECGSQDSAMKRMQEVMPMKLYKRGGGVWETEMSPLDSIRYHKKLLHIGFVAMEPQTRYVKAWVGDLDYRFFKFDHVSQARRQPGSTFKLFVYAAAIASGMEPCETRVDRFVEWKYKENGKDMVWRPHNVTGKFFGIPVSLKYAFAHSINAIAVMVAKEVGIEKVIAMAYSMGIRSPLEKVPSVCLGSSDVTLLELVNSYATVIADGNYEPPVLVTRIEDRNGQVLWEHESKRQQVIDYRTSFLMTEMLKAGMTEKASTTQALRKYNLFRYGTEFGGKTGTSSNHSDGWFVGVSPGLIGGVWVGGEQRCIHFRNGYKMGEGGYAALPVFGLFMEKVMNDASFAHYRQKFPKPKEVIKDHYECLQFIPDSLLEDSTDTEIDSLMIEG